METNKTPGAPPKESLPERLEEHLEERLEEQPKKPGILNQLIPYILVTVIFVWLSHQTDWTDVLKKFQEADLEWFVPAILLFVIAFFSGDCLSFGIAYRWFNAPDLKPREIMEMRGGPYLIQILFAPLAEAFFPLYLTRKKGVPFVQIISTNVFVIMNDTYAIFTVMTGALIYNHYTQLVDLSIIWTAVMILAWAFITWHLVYWRTGLKERLWPWVREHNLGRTFDLATVRHYFFIYLIRLGLLCTTLLSNYAALRAMGVNPPIPLALVAFPIIVMSVFWPISVAGQGGPQALALLFFVKAVADIPGADSAAVTAYATLWTTCFTLGRAFWGVIFIRGFWRGTFPEGFRNWRKGGE